MGQVSARLLVLVVNPQSCELTPSIAPSGSTLLGVLIGLSGEENSHRSIDQCWVYTVGQSTKKPQSASLPRVKFTLCWLGSLLSCPTSRFPLLTGLKHGAPQGEHPTVTVITEGGNLPVSPLCPPSRRLRCDAKPKQERPSPNVATKVVGIHKTPPLSDKPRILSGKHALWETCIGVPCECCHPNPQDRTALQQRPCRKRPDTLLLRRSPTSVVEPTRMSRKLPCIGEAGILTARMTLSFPLGSLRQIL
jgi:hypothetical protein